MQIVSIGDNLHEMSNLVFLENNKNIINLSSAEFAKRVVKVKCLQDLSQDSTACLTAVDKRGY